MLQDIYAALLDDLKKNDTGERNTIEIAENYLYWNLIIFNGKVHWNENRFIRKMLTSFFFIFGRHSEYFAQFSMSTVMQNFHALLKPYKIEGTFQKRHFGIFFILLN